MYMHNIYGGGSNTNVNGLTFEAQNDLKTILRNHGYTVNDSTFEVRYNGYSVGYSLRKKELDVFLSEQRINQLEINSKKWEPDDLFINHLNRTVYIIEKKFQSSGGSVDEKLSTFQFKIYEYNKLFNPLSYGVKYIYLLSEYFHKDKYRDYFDYMLLNGCAYYFNDLPLEAIGLSYYSCL